MLEYFLTMLGDKCVLLNKEHSFPLMHVLQVWSETEKEGV
jgi:hypothetical protein